MAGCCASWTTACRPIARRARAATHPDRDAQFEHINANGEGSRAAGEPAISVDTKKKELVGDFKNGGRELRPKGDPEPVRVHDFKIPELGKVAPYGVYDIAANHGWVSVGIDRRHRRPSPSRASDAGGTTRQAALSQRDPSDLITADCGGSNGARGALWKRELQRFANETGLTITVSHLPPGTSKWNRIEHRLFAFITQNWRGKPLVSHQVIVQLIAATTTETGLTVCCEIDGNALSEGHQGHRRRDGRHQHRTRRLPRRVELHHLTPDHGM